LAYPRENPWWPEFSALAGQAEAALNFYYLLPKVMQKTCRILLLGRARQALDIFCLGVDLKPEGQTANSGRPKIITL
jgi:hypothetical protein